MCLPCVKVPKKETFFPMEVWNGKESRSVSVREQIPCPCGCEEKPSGMSVLL